MRRWREWEWIDHFALYVVVVTAIALFALIMGMVLNGCGSGVPPTPTLAPLGTTHNVGGSPGVVVTGGTGGGNGPSGLAQALDSGGYVTNAVAVGLTV